MHTTAARRQERRTHFDLPELFILGRAPRLANSRCPAAGPRSTTQTAIGVKHPQIVQKSQGALGRTYNTRAFFHGASASTMRGVLLGFPVLAFFTPTLLLAVDLAQQAPGALAGAFVLQYLGLLGERWFFFAQARHPQNLYYQTIA